MKGRLVLFLVTVLGLVPSVPSENFNPDLAQCTELAAKAHVVTDLQALSSGDLNALDWKFSVCESKFVPLQPTGLTLVLDAHGAVADELRNRLEKAIKTLPPSEQAQVWNAFRSE